MSIAPRIEKRPVLPPGHIFVGDLLPTILEDQFLTMAYGWASVKKRATGVIALDNLNATSMLAEARETFTAVVYAYGRTVEAASSYDNFTIDAKERTRMYALFKLIIHMQPKMLHEIQDHIPNEDNFLLQLEAAERLGANGAGLQDVLESYQRSKP